MMKVTNRNLIAGVVMFGISVPFFMTSAWYAVSGYLCTGCQNIGDNPIIVYAMIGAPIASFGAWLVISGSMELEKNERITKG